VLPSKLDLVLEDVIRQQIMTLEQEGKNRCRCSGGRTITWFDCSAQDTLREDAKAALADLRSLGINGVMLTGDNTRSAAAIAAELK